jgi:hypothetical protein
MVVVKKTFRYTNGFSTTIYAATPYSGTLLMIEAGSFGDIRSLLIVRYGNMAV